jgi:hypothetical protein
MDAAGPMARRLGTGVRRLETGARRLGTGYVSEGGASVLVPVYVRSLGADASW